jgi:crotonobetainyl-CoA:carnitine CoA-transferase CaiB-like acyl-CoA transferase
MIGLSADGRWMQFSQTTDKLWAAFLRVTDLEWTTKDPRLAEGPASEDVEVRAEFWDLALASVRSKTYDEWLEVFDAETDVWAEIFRQGTELLHHPQLIADQRLTTLVDPVVGPVLQPGPLATLAATPAHVDRPAPALGRATPTPNPKLARLRAHATPDRANFDAGEGNAPLAGTTVLELGTFFAAPFGATILAELGARVIKLEQLEGDPVRHVMPFPELSGVKVLQGKQSVGIDLATPEGREIALDLAAQADVVPLAFRGGVAGRLCLGPDELRAVNPDLVVLEAPGYGVGPPCGHRPAFAPTMGAGSGLAFRNLAGGVPVAPLELSPDDVKREAIRLSAAAMAVAQADGFSALVVASTMLLGLFVQRRHGIGQAMSTSMLSTMAHVLSETMVEYDGIEPVPVADADLLGMGPWYRLYRCEDGWVFLAAPAPADQAAVRRALGVDLPAEGDELATALAETFAGGKAGDWEAQLTTVDVACVEVARRSIEETVLFGDLGRDLGVVVDAHHPVIEDHPRLAPLVRFSRSKSVVAAPSPLCGADTDTVLEGFGYDEARRAQLRTAGVIT